MVVVVFVSEIFLHNICINCVLIDKAILLAFSKHTQLLAHGKLLYGKLYGYFLDNCTLLFRTVVFLKFPGKSQAFN